MGTLVKTGGRGQFQVRQASGSLRGLGHPILHPSSFYVPGPSRAGAAVVIRTSMKTLDELKRFYDLALPELMFRAAEVHRANHDVGDVQRCALLSIKTGGCPEGCGYCAQSARYQTGVPATPLMSVAEVRERAERARELGATRFCMGAAWRGPRDGEQF